jgi:lipopolysaccharide transport system ATP-binding protein
VSETLIQVEGVSKKFCKNLKRSLMYGAMDIGSELLGRSKSPELRKDEFWAVRDVSFEVRRGECLGLIGHNGAGKSTLLKMLNGLIAPDTGRITMKGRIGALIELGTGFNPILTGRENVYNNGTVLGFSRQEIDRKFDAIVDFAEIGEFIDSPVKNYSSGMKVRLGFAVAAQMEPDVLIIDEVLAVGDISFGLKCFKRMDQLLKNTAIILVSHSMPQVSRMCSSLILMERGQISYQGDDVSAGISQYYMRLDKPQGTVVFNEDILSLKHIRLISGEKTSDQESEFLIQHGDPLTIEIDIHIKESIEEPRIYLAFFNNEQRNICEILNFNDYIDQRNYTPGIYTFRTHFARIEFAHGFYAVTLGVSHGKPGEKKNLQFRIQNAIYFMVQSKKHGWAALQLQPKWEVQTHE